LPRDLRVKTGVNYEFLEQAMDALANPVRLRLLAFLTTPHYLEEIASHLKLTRQAARKHLDRMVEIGLLERRAGVRESGPVTEYMLNTQALFLIHDEVGKLGTLRPREPTRVMSRTQVEVEPEESVPARGPCLIVARGLTPGQRFPLERGPEPRWVIGREPGCQVAMQHDPYASNRHAEVRWSEGGFSLADLGSTNGTQLNWGPLPRGGEAPLRHGDVVGVGRSLLLFWGTPGR
jgi:DNA-binding transcriptional ArsR family regulator